MQDREWFKSAVVYQVYPRSFADSDGDGIGDLGGILAHLDHFEALGVDVVWLSPIYRSPQADNGYDISDYQDVDPLFGTLEQLDELIAGLHERGIKLVMDLVVNHTSDEHPWFVESRTSKDSPKRDWYVWRDGKDGAEPNNWGSFFSGSAWQRDEATDQYYLHLFDRKQPDLNWENEEVREAVHAMMRWWLDRGVDGFRMDVINFISKEQSFADAPPVAGQPYVNAFSMFADGPRIHEFLAEMHEQVFAGRDGAFLTVGEMPGVTTDEAIRYTDPERAEVDMVFQFEHVSIDQGPASKWDWIGVDRVALKRSLHRWQVALAERGWNSLYWDNHDQPRAVSRFGDDDPAYWAASAKALATILHCMRGTPYVYQGEELGMTNYPFRDASEHRDVEAVNHWKRVLAEGLDQQAALTGMAKVGRDNARTPVQWDAGPTAGFTTGEPWLPVNPNRSWLNAAAQVGVEGSVFEHHRALIRLRHEHEVIADGDFTAVMENDPDVWAYVRTLGAKRLLVVANCGRSPRELELGDGWAGTRLLLSNEPDRAERLGSGRLTLAGWESRVYLAE
ncbi:alpha-glucosidase [Amnibacterium endophyticum]|uniref:Alpha-glucosidase n=1 Tax=Amnibacterium endophyticum TaxID=2109337 RepID=A0ABW4LBM7_9MICO